MSDCLLNNFGDNKVTCPVIPANSVMNITDVYSK